MRPLSDAQLDAYLDEALPAELLAEIERRLRDDADLRSRLVAVIGRREAGLHTIGGIWRRNRLSCADREELKRFLEGSLEAGHADYLRFHLSVIGCRFCKANLDDLIALREASAAADSPAAPRRKRYYESSAGHLPGGGERR